MGVMGKLSVYLPPFAGDYSGACAALFDFRCLIVLCDAACCTKTTSSMTNPGGTAARPPRSVPSSGRWR